MRNNQEIIKQIESNLEELVVSMDKAQSLLIEEEMLGNIEKLACECKSDNSRILQPLHLYFAALYSIGRLTLDTIAESPSISMFTAFFINKKTVIIDRFEKSQLQKVILTLLLANLSIHRVQHADKLLNEYIDIFKEGYKAWLYIKILNATCGILDANRIVDLFNRSLDSYNAFFSVSDKADHLYKLYYLEKSTLIRNPHLDELIKDFSNASMGLCDSNICKVYREFCLNNENLLLVDKWIKSLDSNSLDADEKKVLEELKYFLDERKKGVQFIRVPARESGNDNSDASHIISMIKKHYNDRDYNNGELLYDVKKGINYYTYKSANAESLDDRINAFLNSCELQLMKPAVEFWYRYETSLSKVVVDDNDRIDDTVFIVINEYSLVNAATTFPFLLEAKRRGVPCYSFSAKLHLDRCKENSPLYELYGMFNDGRDKRYLPNNDISDAIIDIDNKRIILDGMNIYQPIFEIISRYQFTYEYRFDTDAWARYRTVFLIRKYKALFEYIKEIEMWAKQYSKKVYFISNAPHIHNAAAFRIYCEETGYKNNLFFICTSPGYDNYFLNSTDPRSLTTTALNMTKHLDCRNSFLGTKEDFEKYYAGNVYRIGEIRQKMQSYLEARRSNKTVSFIQRIEKQRIKRKINKARKQGKTIILLNGKVILDLGVKYTKGCIHGDMSEWITHAVSFANNNKDDILLLIKPHPHENRQDLTMTSEKIEDLKSIIHTDMGSAVYLDNNLFTNFELAPHIDLGMVWNGTSAVEFAAEGKKVLLADEWGHKDYPIGFVYPKSIQEYESYMMDPCRIIDRDDLQDRAITFLEYIGSDTVRIKNKYSQTTLMNFNQNESVIDDEAVREFAKNGDRDLKHYFDNLL